MSKALIQPVSTQLPAHLVTDTAAGNENLTGDDLAVPYISLLQSLSKPCTKGTPQYVQGAEAGTFYNTVTKKTSEELTCANMFMDTIFSVNKKRKLGDDFQGEFVSEDAALEHLESEGLNPVDYDIVETAKHMLALLDPKTGELQSAGIFSFRNTALKASRMWNTQILSSYPDADRFAGIWKITAGSTSNKMGAWFIPNVELIGFASADLYKELQAKYKQWRGTDAK